MASFAIAQQKNGVEGVQTPLSLQQRAALNHVMYRSPQMVAYVARARQAIEAGDLRTGLRMLQQVLGDPRGALDPSSAPLAPADSLTLTMTGVKSLRREVLEIFESLDNEQLAVYERTFGATAAEALEQAVATGNLTLLQEVVRRCWPTAAGARAVDLLATRLLDRGQLDSAARLWNELASSRVHRHRVDEAVYEKAAVAQVLSGNSRGAEETLRQLGTRFGVTSLSITDLERDLLGSIPHVDGVPISWGSPFGSTDHNAVSQGSTPWLKAEWSMPLSGDEPFEMLDKWEQQQVERESGRPGVAACPIVVNGQIVVRDLDGVRGCDPTTGRVSWRFDGTMNVRKFADRVVATGYQRSPAMILDLVWLANAATGVVTTDGDRVFAVEWLEFSVIAPAVRTSRRTTGPTIRAANRLVCLQPPESATDAAPGQSLPAQVAPLWVAGGTHDGSPSDPLNGHLFVGPPIVSGDSVFAVVESYDDKELKLARIEARTGQVVWMQTLGIVERPMFSATRGATRRAACIPAIASGIVVCPTDAGYLVGVDAVTGELLWLQTYLETGRGIRSRFGSFTLHSTGSDVGHPDAPHIEGNRVVYLPPHSEDVHCYNLTSGVEVWKIPRGQDQYVAAVRNDVVAIVGESSTRGVSLTDGSELWERQVGLPSGRGVQTDDGYLLPLKSGNVAKIDLATGNSLGSTIIPTLLERQFDASSGSSDEHRPSPTAAALARFGMTDESIPSEVRPGNLLLHDGRVFSVGSRMITAFPQAGALLLELHSRRESTQAVDLFQLACLELLAGERTAGEATLVELAENSGHPQQRQARWMLRKLILAELRSDDHAVTAAHFRERIAQLEALSDSPFDVQQALFEKVRWEQELGDQTTLLAAVAELSKLNLRSFVPHSVDDRTVVSSQALSRDMIRDALQAAGSTSANPLREILNRDLLLALRSDSVEDLQRFLSLYGDTRHAARIRNRLADLLILRGDVQAAEFALLPNLESPDRSQRAVSQLLYVALLSQMQFDAEAGQALEKFIDDSRGVSIDGLLTDSLKSPQSLLRSGSTFYLRQTAVFDDFIAEYDRTSQAWQKYQDLQPLAWDVRRVRIERKPYSTADPELIRVWGETPQKITSPGNGELAVVQSRSYVNGVWRLIDQTAGTERGRIRIPGRPNLANSTAYRSVGHFVPAGATASLMGISLLEYRNQSPVWVFSFPPVRTTHESLEPGPSTSSLSVFQTKRHLIAVDPRNGDVLWRRSNLNGDSGVFVEREAGLFGDDHVIVMFHADQQSYTRFDALTGDVLNEGRLPVDFRFGKRIFGRKLFHVSETNDNGERFVRVWDPLKETIELDEPIAGRFFHDVAESGEFALLNSAGRLRVYRMPNVELLIDTEIGASAMESVTTFQFFTDRDRFYVNLQKPRPRNPIGAGQNERHYPVTDSVPADPLEEGLLLAVDRITGRILWRRQVPHKSVLRLKRSNLPFLVAVSRVQVRRGLETVQNLDLDVIDRSTGATLGHERNLVSDRIVHYRFDRKRGRLELHGLTSRIDLDFRRSAQGILLEQQRL
jgi:outer membrane protein assembly factor BamB